MNSSPTPLLFAKRRGDALARAAAAFDAFFFRLSPREERIEVRSESFSIAITFLAPLVRALRRGDALARAAAAFDAFFFRLSPREERIEVRSESFSIAINFLAPLVRALWLRTAP